VPVFAWHETTVSPSNDDLLTFSFSTTVAAISGFVGADIDPRFENKDGVFGRDGSLNVRSMIPADGGDLTRSFFSLSLREMDPYYIKTVDSINFAYICRGPGRYEGKW
jgi:hypothetical protein